MVPCSAVDGFQVGLLADLLVARLPEGPPLYPDGELTDEPEETLVAELVREAALEGVRDELPHSIAVVVQEMVPREGRDDLLDVHATVYVERSSQKGIVIGQGRRAAARGRDGGPPPDRGPARHQGVPGPARHGGQGLAARPAAAAQARLLIRRGSKVPRKRSLRHRRPPCPAPDHGVNARGHHPEVPAEGREGHEPPRRHPERPARIRDRARTRHRRSEARPHRARRAARGPRLLLPVGLPRQAARLRLRHPAERA